MCSTAAAERVRGLVGSAVHVMIDDWPVDRWAIEMLAAILVRRNGDPETPIRPLSGGSSALASQRQATDAPRPAEDGEGNATRLGGSSEARAEED